MGPVPSRCGEARVSLQRPGFLPPHWPPLCTRSRKPRAPRSAVSLGDYLPDFPPLALPAQGTALRLPGPPVAKPGWHLRAHEVVGSGQGAQPAQSRGPSGGFHLAAPLGYDWDRPLRALV